MSLARRNHTDGMCRQHQLAVLGDEFIEYRQKAPLEVEHSCVIQVRQCKISCRRNHAVLPPDRELNRTQLFSPPERFLYANPSLVPFVKRKVPSVRGFESSLSPKLGNNLLIGVFTGLIIDSVNLSVILWFCFKDIEHLTNQLLVVSTYSLIIVYHSFNTVFV